MFYLLFCQFSCEPSFPIFKDTIYIRVMSKTAGNNMFDWFRRHFIASPET